jgi:hypothetical protein
VLAVVEAEQRAARGELARQRRQRPLDGLDEHAERARDLLGHVLGDTGELDPPDPVRPAPGLAGRGLRRQARLARAAGAADGHQPLAREQAVQVGQLVTAADEARQLDRQVVRRGVERAQRRRFLVVVAQLEDAFGRGEVAQAVHAAVEQGRVDERRGVRGQHGLAAARAVAQALGAAQRRPGVARVVVRFAGVERDPDLAREVGLGAAAQVSRGGQRVGG